MNPLFLLIFTGLISLLLLVGLLGAAAKLDIISLTVCGHYFNVLFPGLLISMYTDYILADIESLLDCYRLLPIFVCI
jgi:hypothetical protein